MTFWIVFGLILGVVALGTGNIAVMIAAIVALMMEGGRPNG